MSFTHITEEERYQMSALRKIGFSSNQIAKRLNRSPSTISREFRRNGNYVGCWTVTKAQEIVNGRKRKSKMGTRFSKDQWKLVLFLIGKKYSPKQASNIIGLYGGFTISHETIYRHIWADKKKGGEIYKDLRLSSKQRRKRYKSYDSRGVLRNKRCIDDRPIGAKNRSRVGHFEIDTVHGRGSKHCIMTLVDRKTGYLLIGKLKNKTTAELNKRLLKIIKAQNGRIKSITADNGTEFHGYKEIEKKTGVLFYFARPYHSWERGTNENANGLIRQYIRKGTSMAKVTQAKCNSIARQLNCRPRERYDYKTPMELYDPSFKMVHL